MSLATACTINNDLARAKWAFTQSQAISQASGNLDMGLIASANLAQLHQEQGQLHRAAEIYRQAVQLSAGSQSFMTGRIYVGLGEVLYQWNELGEARECIRQGLNLGEPRPEVTALMRGHLALTRLQGVQNELNAAFETLRTAEEFGQANNLPSWHNLLAECRIWLYLQQGNLESALQWHRTHQFTLDSRSFDDSAGFPADLERSALLSRARLQIAQTSAAAGPIPPDRLNNIMAALHELGQSMAAMGRTEPLLKVLVLEAQAHRVGGDTARAIQILEDALALAEPEGYMRLFLDEGPVLADLLRQSIRPGSTSEYGARLLAAFDSEIMTGAPSPQPLVEPLSERELEILGLIAAGKSNQQVADDLILSVGTVKWHLNNIYGKLAVSSRTQAVAQARELKLLP